MIVLCDICMNFLGGTITDIYEGTRMSNLVFSVEYSFVVKYREFKNANLFLVLYTNILTVITVD